MRRDPIAATYARALIDVAAERKELDAVLAEVDLLLGLLRQDRDFRTFILTPSIDLKDKKAALDRIFSGKLSRATLDFVQLVLDKNRQLFLEQMLDAYRSIHDDIQGRVHVQAVTAVPIAEEVRERLSETIAAGLRKTVVLENVVQPQILGGLVIRYGDLVVDGSVRSRLEKVSLRIHANKLGSELIHEN